jgi:FkbM family methyltransferase
MEHNVVYGAGIYGELFCEELEKNGIKIDFVIDQYSSKTNIFNKEIKRLADVTLDNTNVYISITSPVVEINVIKTLGNIGCKSIFSFIDTLEKYPNLIRNCVELTKTWYCENTNFMINEEKIEQLRELLCDKKSLELLERISKFRATLSPKYYPTPDLEPQYFPSDIDLFSHLEEIRFVDGGAFIGDTIESSIIELQKQNKNIDYIASFEPDSENIQKLSKEVSKQKEKYTETNFFIFPCGLWSSNKILTFSNNSNSNSSIVNNIGENKTQIMAIALDEILIGANPNYIKMDIEGAEKEAILGMKDIIKKDSPVLAICLYHKPQDLWELPLLIYEINKDYKMYLRIYGSMGLELVLYCVPKR